METNNDDENPVNNSDFNGSWMNPSETLTISDKNFEYHHSIGSANEGILSGDIIELDQSNGFMAGEIKKAIVTGQDVSVAFEGDYSIFYFQNLTENTVEIDCPQGGVLSGMENIHRNDSTDHVYDSFTRK